MNKDFLGSLGSFQHEVEITPTKDLYIFAGVLFVLFVIIPAIIKNA